MVSGFWWPSAVLGFWWRAELGSLGEGLGFWFRAEDVYSSFIIRFLGVGFKWELS